MVDVQRLGLRRALPLRIHRFCSFAYSAGCTGLVCGIAWLPLRPGLAMRYRSLANIGLTTRAVLGLLAFLGVAILG